MKAAGYIRVSTGKQAEDGWSLGEQEARVKAHAEAQGWEWVELYREAGVSGKRDDRPELAKALAAAKAGEFERLIVPAIDRLGRNTKHLLGLYDELEAEGVGIVSLRESFDTSTPTGRLVRLMLFGMAELESEQKGERVAASTAARAKAGRHVGRVPYGYKSKGGELSPVEAEALIVKRIFAAADAGTTQRDLCRALNADGVKPRQGPKWTQATVRGILTNPIFKGRVRHGDEERDGQHEAIIDADLWDRLAADRERKRKPKGRKPGPGRTPAGPHLFIRGLLRCAHCGSAMQPRTDPGREAPGRYGERRETYRCLGREDDGPDSCPQKPIPRKAIDEAALDYFERVGLDMEATRKQLEAAVDRQKAEVRELLAQAERDHTAAAESLARVTRDYTSGAITAPEWRRLEGDLKAEQKAAAEALAQAGAKAEAVEQGAAEGEDVAALRLAEIQLAVAGEIHHADGLDAVRLALHRSFETFWIRRTDVPREADSDPLAAAALANIDPADLLETLDVSEGDEAEWAVLPMPRGDAVEGAALALDQPGFTAAAGDGETDDKGSPSAPFPVAPRGDLFPAFPVSRVELSNPGREALGAVADHPRSAA